MGDYDTPLGTVSVDEEGVITQRFHHRGTALEDPVIAADVVSYDVSDVLDHVDALRRAVDEANGKKSSAAIEDWVDDGD